MSKYWKILVIPMLLVLALRGSWKADPKIEAARLEAIEAAREFSTASSMVQIASMPFVPTDDIALAAPDRIITESLILKRFAAVRSLVDTTYRDFTQIVELSNPEMMKYCPTFATLTAGQRITFFAFLLDSYVHALPVAKRSLMPIVDPKKMTPKELEEHRQEYGDIAALESKEEYYELIGRFDEGQVHLKARELLRLFQRGAVTPEELQNLLKPDGLSDSMNDQKRVGRILGLVKFCQAVAGSAFIPTETAAEVRNLPFPRTTSLSIDPPRSPTPPPPPSVLPSFACTGQLQPAEISVCNNEDLAKRDVQLVSAYQKLMALAANDEQRASLKTEQRSWLASRNACGSAVPCLTSVYRGRQAEFALALKPAVASTSDAPPQKTSPSRDGEAKDIRRVSSDVSGGILNLRAAPNVQGQLLVEIPAGSGSVVVESCQPKTDAKLPWCKVRWNNTSGWVSSGGLRK
jgi:uncharacterized protein YecT (DUF1311 family)